MLSTAGLFVVWPFAAMMTTFAHDAPTVDVYFSVVRLLLVATLLGFPAVWGIALVLWIIEACRKKREHVMDRLALAPLTVLAAHLLIWVVLFATTS